ncbi:hypothetical protein RRSWK_02194 [Rhodopirellula sp. SWK7]|nr:hypothetical protein RRSWK_02194 [Rhodopirellula sp. SWK7]
MLPAIHSLGNANRDIVSAEKGPLRRTFPVGRCHGRLSFTMALRLSSVNQIDVVDAESAHSVQSAVSFRPRQPLGFTSDDSS